MFSRSAIHRGVVPLSQHNLPRCMEIWPDRTAFTEAEFAQLLETCRSLLAERRARGALVFEAQRPRGYGISTFVHESFADEYLAHPQPQIARRLLLERTSAAILDHRGVAQRNRCGGLQLVAVSSHWDYTAEDPGAVMGLLINAFVETHRGYRIARFINEVFGDPEIEFLRRSGHVDVHQAFDEVAPGTRLPSVVGVLTAERAAIRASFLLSLFVYNPPRVLFTFAEQELLRTALDGAPDDVIAGRLGVPVSSVKARWTRVHQRVMARLPELLTGVRAPHRADRRGVQIRHLILQYARENPSELTPYSRARLSDGSI